MQKGDFALTDQEQSLAINASTDAVLFAIEAPDPLLIRPMWRLDIKSDRGRAG